MDKDMETRAIVTQQDICSQILVRSGSLGGPLSRALSAKSAATSGETTFCFGETCVLRGQTVAVVGKKLHTLSERRKARRRLWPLRWREFAQETMDEELSAWIRKGGLVDKVSTWIRSRKDINGAPIASRRREVTPITLGLLFPRPIAPSFGPCFRMNLE